MVENTSNQWVSGAHEMLIMQGDTGWDIIQALQDVKERAQASGDTSSMQAATAVEKRVQKVCFLALSWCYTAGKLLSCFRTANCS